MRLPTGSDHSDLRPHKFTRIGDYALIGDGRSAALISRNGSIDWLAWPRFDSASAFAAVLDPAQGGSWTIAPVGSARIERHYHLNGS